MRNKKGHSSTPSISKLLTLRVLCLFLGKRNLTKKGVWGFLPKMKYSNHFLSFFWLFSFRVSELNRKSFRTSPNQTTWRALATRRWLLFLSRLSSSANCKLVFIFWIVNDSNGQGGSIGSKNDGNERKKGGFIKGNSAKTYTGGFFKPEPCRFSDSPKPKGPQNSGQSNNAGLIDPLMSSLMHSRYLTRPSTSRVQSKPTEWSSYGKELKRDLLTRRKKRLEECSFIQPKPADGKFTDANSRGWDKCGDWRPWDLRWEKNHELL